MLRGEGESEDEAEGVGVAVDAGGVQGRPPLHSQHRDEEGEAAQQQLHDLKEIWGEIELMIWSDQGATISQKNSCQVRFWGEKLAPRISDAAPVLQRYYTKWQTAGKKLENANLHPDSCKPGVTYPKSDYDQHEPELNIIKVTSC